MKDFVVDVGVLFHGAGLGDEARHVAPCRDLMEMMREHDCARLVLDQEDTVSNHYRHKLGTSLATQWVLELSRRNKILVVERARVPKGRQVKLRESGFPTKNEDYKYYTRTAASSPSHRLVAVDPHFIRAAKMLSKLLDVQIVAPQEACEMLRSDCC